MEHQKKRLSFINVFAEFQNMQNTMKIVSGVMMVAMVGLYLYLIKRLRSDAIREEFL